MRKIIHLLILLSSAFLPVANSQETISTSENLVFNPSFEEYLDCPHKIDALGTLTIVEAWFQPTSGSADYFNVCGSKDCGVPKNKLGEQHAHTGLGYCGIYCSKTDYREYLQTQLKHPLEAGQTYQLKFYVSLSEYSSGSVATIGGLLTRDRISDTVRSVLMRKQTKKISPKVSQTVATYLEPQVVNPYHRVLTNTQEWTLITGTFEAEGGEQFLTIGNFYPASQSNVVDLDYLTYLLPGAYYYIDDISLTCLTCGQQPNPEIDTTTLAHAPTLEDSLQVGATFILKDIYFDYDKSILLQQSYTELRNLISLLEEYPKLKIEVGGHTDGRGSVDYNNRLSESRAKSVVDYLISKGIDPRRLQYKGYGKSRPITTNDTEEGRAKNRRVEFRVLSM